MSGSLTMLESVADQGKCRFFHGHDGFLLRKAAVVAVAGAWRALPRTAHGAGETGRGGRRDDGRWMGDGKMEKAGVVVRAFRAKQYPSKQEQ